MSESKNPKELRVCEKSYIWNLITCSCKNGKYLGSIIDNSVAIYDEVIDTTKAIPAKAVLTKYTSKLDSC